MGGSSSILLVNVAHDDVQTHVKNFLRKILRFNVMVTIVKTSPELGVCGHDKLADARGKTH